MPTTDCCAGSSREQLDDHAAPVEISAELPPSLLDSVKLANAPPVRILSAMRFVVAFIGALASSSLLLSQAGTLAIFKLPFGDIEVELLETDKPATVNNFVRYVQTGYTNNMVIHRWETKFVIQGGSWYTANRGETNAILRELDPFDPITNEFNVGRAFSNTFGTLAMARKPGVTNSASSNWFFNLGDNSRLDAVDGGFTVFGRVVRGTNILDKFNQHSTNTGIYRINLGAPLTTVPVLSTDPSYDDLVYVDISLLAVQVARTARGQPEISWPSVANVVNRIEYTTSQNLATATWTELISTNGTGERMRIIDTAATGARIYRARVDY